jgi:uncharacterized protein YbcI
MDSTPPLTGDALLVAVTDAMVTMHEHYHGRAPGSAKTRLMGDDMLACVLGDMYTHVEKTLIELDQTALVHDSRSAFQEAMGDRFVTEVQRLSGRPVERFVSTHSVGPDLEVEIFLLGPPRAVLA